jgi:hypothetical protein
VFYFLNHSDIIRTKNSRRTCVQCQQPRASRRLLRTRRATRVCGTHWAFGVSMKNVVLHLITTENAIVLNSASEIEIRPYDRDEITVEVIDAVQVDLSN